MCDLCDEPQSVPDQTRRRLVLGGAAAAALMLAPATALAARPRTLSLYHTHTGEKLRLTYAEGGVHLPDALEEVSRFLRDFRSGESHPIDPRVLDILHRAQQLTGGTGPYEIISAYRSPQTNEMLRTNTSGVARRSLHMEGKAIDVRLRGVETHRLRQAAVGQKAGGVGYYRDSNFIHVDTGRVRYW